MSNQANERNRTDPTLCVVAVCLTTLLVLLASCGQQEAPKPSGLELAYERLEGAYTADSSLHARLGVPYVPLEAQVLNDSTFRFIYDWGKDTTTHRLSVEILPMVTPGDTMYQFSLDGRRDVTVIVDSTRRAYCPIK